MQKQKIRLARNNLLYQYSIFFLFLLAVHFLPSTGLVAIISLFALLISGFVLFFYKGKIQTRHFFSERWVLFLLQLVIFRKLGNNVSSVFGWNANQLLYYWLPLYQLACMFGYNLGIKRINKSSSNWKYRFAK